MGFKRAIVDWIPFEEGGRRIPPTGEEPPIYWAVVKFVDSAAGTAPTNSWSLAVRLVGLLGGPFHWIADVQFRVEEAPHHLLAEGAAFELYEGKKRVATGRVTASGL